MMAGVIPMTDRQDIHKSCKSIETLVNVLNDYCEALGAVVIIQKKLVKALRECASVKSTAETAVNALSASASIFESVHDVDHKFAKSVDKECEGMIAEVKKWFKKLAKEEKTYDDKMAHANAKIKQAGQLYEKKAKKNPREAQEEHTRYVALLSSLGPEMTQEKYNHSLSVSKRHTSVLQMVAGCLSRVAEEEWKRSCEEVRRISPHVGQVGEWRCLCEGGWTNPVPPDLLDPDVSDAPDFHSGRGTPQTFERDLAVPTSQRTLDNVSRGTTPTHEPWSTPDPSPVNRSRSHENLSTDLRKLPEDRNNSATSLASLGSFPAPPTHFPLPPVHPTPQGLVAEEKGGENGGIKDRHSMAEEGKDVMTSSEQTNEAKGLHISTARPTASSSGGGASQSSTPLETASPTVPFDSMTNSPQLDRKPAAADHKEREPVKKEDSPFETTRQSASASSSGTSNPNTRTLSHGDYLDGAEFGIRKAGEPTSRNSKPRAETIERSDTGRSNGSMVAALRDRYSRATGQASPPPKDVLRLPFSVSNLATRYESSASSPSPTKQTTRASPHEKRRNTIDSSMPNGFDRTHMTMPHPFPSGETPAYRAHQDEVRELEFREQEHRLRLRERDIEEQAIDLERERVRLMTTRRNGYTTPERGWVDSPSSTSLNELGQGQIRSNSATRLVPPSYPSYGAQQYPDREDRQRRLYTSNPSSPILPHPDHASSCGCQTCSASKYGLRHPDISSRDLRPPDPPIVLRQEKPKGWIRRLSMPVIGGGFSSESKKGVSGNAVFGAGYRGSLALADEDGRMRGILGGGTRNRSTSNLGGR